MIEEVLVEVISIRTPSLGDATYIAVHGDQAIVVDPQRDIGRFLSVIQERGLTLTHVLETHMHNDYISGGRDLARELDADLILPAGSGAGFTFVPAFHHEEIEAGSGLAIRPLHTPGHTPEHISYLLVLDGQPHSVFTGGSLLVGAAGRSDLLGEQFARQLSRLQYGSLLRLSTLPGETGVFPTHGEGSFCTASGAGRTTSTIGQELAENPLYRHADAEAFADDQLGGLVPYPTYYAHMGPTNKQDPTAFDASAPPELDPAAVESHLADGASVLDGRLREAFAEGHLPGSIGIELGDSFAPWAGWVLDYDSPIVLVLDDSQDAQLAVTELSRIGFTSVLGVLRGVAVWADSGRPISSYRNADARELHEQMAIGAAGQILDVRDPLEWQEGHLEGSVHRYVPDLLDGLPNGISATEPVWVVCRTGNRASIAAGLLERHGVEPIVVSKGGVTDILAMSA